MAIKPRPNQHAELQARLTLTPRESVKLTRFGLNHTYDLLKRGEMPAIRVGKRFFIPRSALIKHAVPNSFQFDVIIIGSRAGCGTLAYVRKRAYTALG